MTDPALLEFERHRDALLRLAYRMLGERARSEDVVQDAWLRYAGATSGPGEVRSPRAYLAKVVTRLCLNELDSARSRREVSDETRLPEPLPFEVDAADPVDQAERISMALMVALQRLSPVERAVLLLADVLGFRHAEIASLLGRTEAHCRQILRRGRRHVAEERGHLLVSHEEHRELLDAFLQAARAGDTTRLVHLLAADVALTVDPGSADRTYGRTRALPRPIVGRERVAAFLAAVTPQGADGLEVRACRVFGEPAALVLRGARPEAAIMVAIAGGRIRRVFVQADRERLGHLS